MDKVLIETEFDELKEKLVSDSELKDFLKWAKAELFDCEKWIVAKGPNIKNLKQLSREISNEHWTIDNKDFARVFFKDIQHMMLMRYKKLDVHLLNILYVKENAATQLALIEKNMFNLLDENKQLVKQLEEERQTVSDLSIALKNFKQDYRDEVVEEILELVKNKEEVKEPVKKSKGANL